MATLQITPTRRIQSDERSWAVQDLKENKIMKKGKETDNWVSRTYHTTLFGALNACKRLALRESDALSMEQLQSVADKFNASIASAERLENLPSGKSEEELIDS